MRDHYEHDVIIAGTTHHRIACAGAREHGAMWHDAETAQYRNMDLTVDSDLHEWLEAAAMDQSRRISAMPLYLKFDTDVEDGEYRIIETTADGQRSRHGSTTDKDWNAVQPHEFGALWDEIAATMRQMGVDAQRSVLMRLNKDRGSVLVGCIRLGRIDFGAGDVGDYFLTIVTSYDGTRQSEVYCSVRRAVCANMEAIGHREATIAGRVAPVSLAIKNKGGNKVMQLRDIAVQCAEPFGKWSQAHAEKMKALKAVRLKGADLFNAVYDAGIESGALKRGKDKGGSVDSIPLDDSVIDALRGFHGSKLRDTNVGEKLIGAIVVSQVSESRLGIEDCIDTAYGAYQGITRWATRRGEEGSGPFVSMAQKLANNVLGVRQ